MKNNLNYLLLILGMSFVTYFPRMLPAAFLSKRKIPELFVCFLKYIPVAALSALFFPSVLMMDNKLNISVSNHLFVAALVASPIAFKTKNMFLTVLLGMIFLILLNQYI